MIYKTEYASSYVWHDSAYSNNKPERQTKGRIRHSMLSRYRGSLQQLNHHHSPQLEQHNILENVLYFPFHSTSEDVKVKDEDENQTSIFNIGGGGSSSSSNKKRQAATKQKPLRSSSLSLRRYSLDEDARGIKSHFLPATLDVLLDIGLNSSKSTRKSVDDGSEGNAGDGGEAMEVDSEMCANQYFTSVYKSDFSGTK